MHSTEERPCHTVKVFKMLTCVLKCPEISWENTKPSKHAKRHRIDRVLAYQTGKGKAPGSNLLDLTWKRYTWVLLCHYIAIQIYQQFSCTPKCAVKQKEKKYKIFNKVRCPKKLNMILVFCAVLSPVEKKPCGVKRRDTNNSLNHFHHQINNLQSLPISWNPLL